MSNSEVFGERDPMFEQTTREYVYICLTLRDKPLEFENTIARDLYTFITSEELKS